ncbi:MAG: GTP cyclohydrolase I FolE [Aestuariivirgaceae bacterium]
MDAIVKKIKSKAPEIGRGPQLERPTKEQAMEAVRTLIAWAGDDPNRDGVQDTPQRVVKAYQELFNGYNDCPLETLSRTFDDVGGYDDIVMLRNIEFNSHCEHHMVPFIGRAHVAYLPTERVVGISKLARVVEIFARRLQTQETMTTQIAQSIAQSLQPRGVAVMIDAVHMCMSMRGVNKQNVSTITTQFTGEFKQDPTWQARFMELVRSPSGGFPG